jgi:hypothetical protein
MVERMAETGTRTGATDSGGDSSLLGSDGFRKGTALTAGVVLVASLAWFVPEVGSLLILVGWLVGGIAGLAGGFYGASQDPTVDGWKVGAAAGGLGNVVGGILGSVVQVLLGVVLSIGSIQETATQAPELGASVAGAFLFFYAILALIGLVTGTVCAVLGGLAGGALAGAV